MVVLAKRIEIESEEKRVTQNQTEFRKGMGTMDNIYVINFLINRQLGKRKKVIAMFIDLKAFDAVNREILGETMRGRGIEEGLIERVREVLKETRSRMKKEKKRENVSGRQEE